MGSIITETQKGTNDSENESFEPLSMKITTKL